MELVKIRKLQSSGSFFLSEVNNRDYNIGYFGK